MKIALYRTRDQAAASPEQADAVVLAMLGAMTRREPATPLTAAIPGGAVGAWIEGGDDAAAVLARDDDGSFALGDATLLAPASAQALLDSVRAEGERALRRLDGSFAAVVHDARAGRTLVVTDRFATRPVYVHEAGGQIVLASEAKALFAAPGVSP